MFRSALILSLLCLCASLARAQTLVAPNCSGNAASDTGALQSLVRAAETYPRTIQLPYKSDPATLCKLNSITFPSNITLDLTQGGIEVVSGQKVTAQGPIVAPPAKTIFYNALSGQGTVVLNGTVYPDWWVANASPGTTDMTAAIVAANAAVCSGTVGPDGVTVAAQGIVRFNSAIYRLNSGVSYRGAPWAGEGPNNTILDYRGTGAVIDAVGSANARRQLNIANLTLTGANSRNGASGMRLGWNQRSFQGLTHINIEHFPAPGILFAADEWQMSFYDVAVIACGSVSGSGIDLDPAITSVNQLNWFNLQLENNGQGGSSRAGGIDATTSAIHQWDFYGGIFQGNKGAAEARFVNGANVGLFGVYIESGLAAAGAVDGLIFGGGVTASLVNLNFHADTGHGGTALRCTGSSKCSIDNLTFHSNWPTAIAVENTATVQILSLGNLIPGVSAVNDSSGRGLLWNLYRNGIVVRKQVTPATATSTTTLTIANLLAGIITAQPPPAGVTVVYTLPTGPDMDAGGSFADNDSFDWSITNLATAAADTITIKPNAAHTIIGNSVIQSLNANSGLVCGTSAVFRSRRVSAGVWITYRLS